MSNSYRHSITHREAFWTAFGYFIADYLGDAEAATDSANAFVAYLMERQSDTDSTLAIVSLLQSDVWR